MNRLLTILKTIRNSHFELPLLAKDLLEQSQRKRTYVLRCVYVCLLIGLAYGRFEDFLVASQSDPLAVLGHGTEMFLQLVGIQFACIYLIMPALACGAITQEKERGTLVFLLISRLSPRTILLEKLLSRLLPMWMFLLMSLPLMAFAYSMGGVRQADLWCYTAILAFSCLQVAGVSLMCSAACASTVAAFGLSYVLNVGCIVIGSCLIGMLFGSLLITPGMSVGLTVVVCVMLTLVSGVCFVSAHAYLERRAFVTPKNQLLEYFRDLDRTVTDLNRLAGGITVLNDSFGLPGDEPIAWRDTWKKSLGTPRYLCRVLLSIEIPLLILLTLISQVADPKETEPYSYLLAVLWVVSIVLVAAQASSLIPGERSRQTLDVLLTTPLSGREIVRQHFVGLRRLILVLCVPFVTIFEFEAWWRPSLWGVSHLLHPDALLYLFCSVLSIAVYLPLVAWLSYWFSMLVHSQARAILVSVLTLLASTFVPLAIWGEDSISPASIIILNETREVVLGRVLLNFGAYGALLFGLRWLCLRNADKYLGRCGGLDESVSLADIGSSIGWPWFSRRPEQLTEGTGP